MSKARAPPRQKGPEDLRVGETTLLTVAHEPFRLVNRFHTFEVLEG